MKACRLAALRSDPHAFTGRLEDALQLPDSEWERRAGEGACGRERASFCLQDGEGKWRGMLSLAWRTEPGPPHTFLMGMWLEPSARGKGYGQTLMAAALQWAERKGDRVFLSLVEPNPPAMRLYQSMGFQQVDGSEWELKCEQPLLNMAYRFSARGGEPSHARQNHE